MNDETLVMWPPRHLEYVYRNSLLIATSMILGTVSAG